MSELTALVANHRIVVCVGSGGVGKTTTAASLALWGALHGRKTAVVTIDPAKRLADCLGLDLMGAEETVIPSETFARAELRMSGSLTALLVDQQSAWDAAVARYAPTQAIHDRILANRFYQGLSRTFAGSHEYMALDALATLSQSENYDLIVLDTPPVQQALDFLEAPMRLQRFLDSRMSKWLMRPTMERGWAAFSAANRTTTFLLRRVEDATGISALGEIAEFFTSMHGMFEDFGTRFTRVSALLSGEETAFVLVTSPDEEVLREAEEFRAGLARLAIALKGVIVNRVHTQTQQMNSEDYAPVDLMARVQPLLTHAAKQVDIAWIVSNFVAHQKLAQGEHARLQKFYQSIRPTVPVVQVPILQDALVDLSGLAALHPYLFD